MTLLQITAILSLLIAFGVDTLTVNHIHDVLIPPVASTTPIVPVPVVQTPIVQNAPVYFGSTAPAQSITPPVVNNLQTPATPVVESKPMANKELTLEIIGGNGQLERVDVYYSEDGIKLANIPITLSTDKGYFLVPGRWGIDAGAGTKVTTIILTTTEGGTGKGVAGASIGHYEEADTYSQDITGHYLPGAIITAIANGITKTIQGRPIYKLDQ